MGDACVEPTGDVEGRRGTGLGWLQREGANDWSAVRGTRRVAHYRGCRESLAARVWGRCSVCWMDVDGRRERMVVRLCLGQRVTGLVVRANGCSPLRAGWRVTGLGAQGEWLFGPTHGSACDGFGCKGG